ncbi:PAS domain-containing sensor histidine kinase [Thiohalorhabdus sp. Cl-TMA]|uniref:PAS domain S-box protein n=1 Tax=Thiohalorhabdus methylotrophus TaxID=3242694 RepID=A0ABV4TSK9_9GAMM
MVEHILRHASEGFLVADIHTLEILEANEALCRMLDSSREALVGSHPNRWLDPRDRETFRHEVQKRWNGANRYHELRFVRGDGQPVPVLANGTTCLDEQGAPSLSVVFITDLSRLKQSEHSVDQLTEILEAFPGLVGRCDGNLHFLYHNRYAKELLGSDLSPHVTVRGIHPDWAGQLMQDEAFPAAAREGYWVGETALLDKRGQEVPFLVTVVAHYDAPGNVERFSLVGIDLSTQKTTEERLRQYAQQLQSVSRLISMEGLTSLLTHQLNQPLAALNNYAAAGNQLLSQRSLDSTRFADLLDRITEEAQKASEVLV